jgi:hypothetical protein
MKKAPTHGLALALTIVVCAAASTEALVVNHPPQLHGGDDVWDFATARNLTYCIDAPAFGRDYAAVVAAMTSAEMAWENTANVRFRHHVELDGDCSKHSPTVFNVRPTRLRHEHDRDWDGDERECDYAADHRDGERFVVKSFFPSEPRPQHQIVVDASAFGDLGPFTLAGVLRHELGHVLGFRDESTRPEAARRCYEDRKWRALTDYDAGSVMQLGPMCGGTNRGDFVITPIDFEGAQQVYPFLPPL